jgi:hypothetical protein
MNLVQTFISEHCIVSPGAVAPLKAFTKGFRATYPTSQRQWPRSRLIVVLTQLGYPVARDGTGVANVVGLCLNSVRREVVDGRLV